MSGTPYVRNDNTSFCVDTIDRGCIIYNDNLEVLRSLPDACIDLIYIDPPFNTGKTRTASRIQTIADLNGDRIGFQGKRYRTVNVSQSDFTDTFNDYLSFLEPRFIECRRVLKETGSLYFHIDYREVHYCKILLDEIFGRSCFINEIIWSYDYGARATRRWPTKHDTILFYAKNKDKYYFDINAVERIPYMAPGLVGPEKAARGKTLTDSWWVTIVPTNGKERLGYATQKPLKVLRNIIRSSCPQGGLVADFFSGSGTTAAAALEHHCRFILVDNNPQAIAIQKQRFSQESGILFV